MPGIEKFLEDVRTVAIAGHVNPDGDCIGSTMGLYLYLKDNYPQIEARVYLEKPDEKFLFLEDAGRIRNELEEDAAPDLLVLLDISSKDRVGVAGRLLESEIKTLCIDHHKTNTDAYTWLFNEPEKSSTCEVLYGFLDPEKIKKGCAEALYMGIAHDSGMFQYPSTSPATMRVVAELMEKGIPFSKIVEDTWYKKTYHQNQMMGRAIMESILLCDGQIIVSGVSAKSMEFYRVRPMDMEGIVSQLRNTEGVEVAIFLYEIAPSVWKVSLRSKEVVDVSLVAAHFGGGGHIRAAGVNMTGTFYDVVNNLTEVLAPLMGYPS